MKEDNTCKEEREGGEEILSPLGRALVPPAAWYKHHQSSQVPSDSHGKHVSSANR